MPGHTAPALLANSSVSADPLADLLTFSVTDPSPTVAMKLASAYAQQFTRYRHKLDGAALSAAIADARRKIKALVGSGEGGSQLSRRLAATEGDLEELQTLQAAGSSAAVVGPAGSASLVQPRTKRNVVARCHRRIGAGDRAGLHPRVARHAGALCRRVSRPLGTTAARSGPQARPPPRGSHGSWPPSTEPTSSSSEAFRILKNNLEMLQLEYHVGSIVITSPLEDEDKSTTAANLAVTLAQSGRHVILVDLNLRDPTVHQLFGLANRLGFTHVAIGGVGVTDALNVVDVYTNRLSAAAGVLEVVTAGHRPRDPGEFLLSNYVPEVLARAGRTVRLASHRHAARLGCRGRDDGREAH